MQRGYKITFGEEHFAGLRVPRRLELFRFLLFRNNHADDRRIRRHFAQQHHSEGICFRTDPAGLLHHRHHD